MKKTHPDPCPECGSPLILKKNKYGKLFYGCQKRCKGNASAHWNGEPMGRAAKARIRTLRVLAHRIIEKYHPDNEDSYVYKWMKFMFNDPEIHIGAMKTPEELAYFIREFQRACKRGK